MTFLYCNITIMDLTKMITDAMTDKVMWEISSKMWLSWDQAWSAISWALPLLMWALSKNASSPEWAQALTSAAKNHNGWIFDKIWELAGNPDAWEWAGILGHLLGWNQENVAQAVAAKAGISNDQAGGLMKVLAPMLMGKLWEAQSSGVDVAGLLGSETQHQNILEKFLDKDWDGKISDDLMGMWFNMLKKKFFG